MKRVLNFMFFLLAFLIIENVSAQEIYYTNKFNVSFSKEEYDFLTFMFWEGAQDLMTMEDYNAFIESNIMEGELAKDEYTMPITRSSSINDNNKTLKISKSCASNCFISLTLTWNNNPSVRSYDVIGAYLENTSLITNPTTTLKVGTSSTTNNDIKTFNNGFGVSVKLPSTGSNIVVNQTFRVSKGGHIYASYQHATKSISLANSKNYTLSRSGYGGVFKFSGVALSTYDGMNGVDIAV